MFQMAAYCRLSKEDGENKVSESIENQIKIIREYVNRSDDLEIADTYIDDGYSGLYFSDRPQFQRMMGDIYRGRIQGVITKDISRLGREHIETSNYIERVFPSFHIRYIAILDGLDSMSHTNEELAQFKTLFNDMYSRDISKKIRGALTVQKKRGQFVSGFAPYGYIKDPGDKHHFILDKEAAGIVRRIYDLYLSGYSRGGIAAILNAEGVPAPSEYKQKVQGLAYMNARKKPGTRSWSYSTIQSILKNRVYTGAMVQHKTEKISYKMKKCRYIPEEEQYIVENMHEEIISRDTFEQARNLGKKQIRTSGPERKSKKADPYAGLLICGDCGCPLQKISRKQGFECGSYHRKGNIRCCSHFIREDTLEEILKDQIQRQIRLCLKEEDREEIAKAADSQRERKIRLAVAERKVKRREEELEAVLRYKKKAYESYLDNVLDREEYTAYQEEYEQQERSIRVSMKKMQEERKYLKQTQVNWIEEFMKSGALTEITREMMMELIEKITVSGDKSLEIEFNYRVPSDIFPYL